MNKMKFNLDLVQEVQTADEIHILMEKLKQICQKKNWEYSEDKAKIIIQYPVQEDIIPAFNTLAFLEELKTEGVELQQKVIP